MKMTEKRYEVIRYENGQYGLKDLTDDTGKHDLIIDGHCTEEQVKDFCKKLNRLESYFEHKEKQNTSIVDKLKREI